MSDKMNLWNSSGLGSDKSGWWQKLVCSDSKYISYPSSLSITVISKVKFHKYLCTCKCIPVSFCWASPAFLPCPCSPPAQPSATQHSKDMWATQGTSTRWDLPKFCFLIFTCEQLDISHDILSLLPSCLRKGRWTKGFLGIFLQSTYEFKFALSLICFFFFF